MLSLLLGVTSADQGVFIPFPDGHSVELAVAGPSAFRVSISYLAGSKASQLSTTFVDPPKSYAPFSILRDGAWTGIKTTFGTIKLNNLTNSFVYSDARGATIVSSDSFTSFDGQYRGSKDTCQKKYQGSDGRGGRRTPGCPSGLTNQNVDSCCAACNKDPDCTFWVFATSNPDPGNTNCWLLEDVDSRFDRGDRVSGGSTGQGGSVSIQLSRNKTARFYGAGGGGGSVSKLTQTSASAVVRNTEFFSPHYWSTEGYGALGVGNFEHAKGDWAQYPVAWKAQDSTVEWTIQGDRADLYLLPGATPYEGLKTYWDVTGPARLPPRYAFGFLACRWGWQSREYIDDILTQFRKGSYPLDAWISDFEWYTPEPDYSLPPTGSPTFKDFDYNPATFPAPLDQLNQYHKQYNVKFGGIRKPRLGNTAELASAASKGWRLADSRDLNYSISAVREYYQNGIAHFLPDGVDFWWNDEGEGQYVTFYYWNLAQVEALRAFDPSKRFFSINRAYTPGVHKWAAAIWTGDISVSWDSLAKTPGYLLNWGLAGVTYVTCDIGGFNGGDDTPELLTRWYQTGVFLSIMRVHSSINNKPHFPFLYGDVAGNAMRKALELRYRLLPTLYSLAHESYWNGKPIFRPLFFEFPDDSNTFEETSEWLLGSQVLAAPVLREDNSRSVYLPKGQWYTFEGTTVTNGPTTLQLSNVPLDAIPIYVRSGSILPLGNVVQFTDALPGGPLNVQVYGGADANFTVYDDDGETNKYESGVGASLRAITFTWTELSKTLAWKVSGTYSDAHSYTAVSAVGFFPGRKVTKDAVSIGTGGTIVLA